MPGGGALRAFFKGAQEDTAQAVESAAGKMAGLGDDTAQGVRDSVSTIRNAESANADAAKGIRGGAGSGTAGSGASNPFKRILDGDGSSAGGSSAGGSSADGAGPAVKKPRTVPDWLKKRWQDGEQFNRDNHSRYPHNEVELATKKRVDSYRPGSEIVERKNTQLSDVKEGTAKGYIDSLRQKYKPGQLIADTPKNRASNLAGKKLSGDHILEVPPQKNPIPQSVLDHATDHDVTIRDTNGKEYN